METWKPEELKNTILVFLNIIKNMIFKYHLTLSYEIQNLCIDSLKWLQIVSIEVIIRGPYTMNWQAKCQVLIEKNIHIE